MNGVVEPFSILTLWEPARREQRPVVSIAAPGPDGRMTPVEVPPTPARPGHWEISVTTPKHRDIGDDGLDRHDRNRDVVDRKIALMSCQPLTPPEGVTWRLALESDPDPAAAARNAARARSVTDMIFGPARTAPAED